MKLSPALFWYRGATATLGAAAGPWLWQRARQGKEDPARLGERFGRYAQARPRGKLIWLHAASVGESGVALALIEALAARDSSAYFLVSTGTRTSADLIGRRTPSRTTHIYAPLDRVDAVRRFLAHWRPDLGVFVESELWPNLILESEAAGVRLALVNARMSPRSLARWERWNQAGARLTRAFAWISAADARSAQTLSKLRGERVETLGNLKLAAPPPRVEGSARQALIADVAARPVWLAASTHPGEDEIALTAHARLRVERPDALLILVPRHPERGAAVAALAGGAPRRALMQPIGDAPVYVADTLGELGLFYAAAPVALVGGSLLAHLKGHNPIEPAKLGAAIVTGPHVESFQDVFGELIAAGGAVRVADSTELADTIARLWRDPDARTRQCDVARQVTAKGAEAFAATVTRLFALVQPAGAAHAPA